MEYEVRKDVDGKEWVWALSQDSKIIASCGRTYISKANCIKAVRRMQAADRNSFIVKKREDGRLALSSLNHFPLAVVEGTKVPSFKTKKIKVNG